MKNNNIEFIHRSFDFSDLKENEFHVKLFFNKDYLLKIKNLEHNRNFIFFI
ncbi:hypothetical protein [Buchnera aphidicola]|uniref:hypothetical protein n=1 Tax=Buchnera aphidicola TaxID=9 RepID=UPI0028FCF562|nr:hypothetical protein [Buchnera aphidicola]